MKKIFISIIFPTILILLGTTSIQGNEAVNICNKEIKKKRPNKQRVQKYCTQAGRYYERKSNDSFASWYYLLGGQNDKNINEIRKATNSISSYRNIGHSYALTGKMNKAKNFYTLYLAKSNIPRADIAIQTNYKLLYKLYPHKKENIIKGLAVWNTLYAPLRSANSLYGNFLKAKKAKHYKEAIQYLTRIITLQEKYQKKDNVGIRDNLYHLGVIYSYDKQYEKSLEALQKTENIYDKVSKKDKNYSDLLVWIANDHQKLHDNKKAIEYRKKSLNITIKLLGKEHTSLAHKYNNLGVLYNEEGEYSKALDCHKKALVITKKAYGENHISTAACYANMGLIYKKTRDYPNALKYQEKALAIQKKVLGEKHPDTAISYNNLAMLYQKTEAYHKALSYARKALEIKEKILGDKHPSRVGGYTNLAGIYKAIGNYPKALKYYQKALTINIEIFGEKHPDTAKSYGNLGMFYDAIGDYQKALKYVQKALSVTEKILGEKHSSTLTSYSNLGFVYFHMGNYSQSLKYHQKASLLTEKMLGKKHPDTAASYNNIAFLYYHMGKYSKALEYNKKTLLSKEKTLGKKHTSTAISYNNLGGLYLKTGDYPKALKYCKKALDIREEVFGTNHMSTAESYNNLGRVYAVMGNYNKAHHYAQQAFNIFLANRDKVFNALDSKQKEKYLTANTQYVDLLLSTTYRYITQLKKEKQTKEAQQILPSGTNAWLNYKGSIFDSENAIAMLYASTKDQKLKVKIDDLVSSKRYMAKLYQSLPKPKERETWKKNIKNTEEKIAKLTNQISSKASSFKEQQGLKSISYKDVTSHLKQNELYIDYAKAGGYYYLFSLDHKENITFIQIDKKSTKKIDNLVKVFRNDVNTILNSKDITDEKLKALTESSKEKLSKLYELVIKNPLGDTIKNKTSIIISSDGALRLLPFEALFDKENNQYFIEEKEIRYIPSGKELVRLYKYSKNKVSKAQKNTIIFANPNFDTKIVSVSKEEIAITPNTSRAGIIKSLFRMRFAALPGTKAEAKAIKATLNKNSVSEYQQNKATESTLMTIKEPKILHIATHGFFINDNTIPNPMLKSGIALAGANASVIKGKSDGVVTALKLSGLNLKGTDLVVLSACETGVVDINSTDSVSGLSKAFIQAGAKDIVMSLWSVDDEATKELMTSFYQEMKENKNYAKALKAAKLKMIEEGRHPFYWGAFVVSGL